jgi:hypothetical protein
LADLFKSCGAAIVLIAFTTGIAAAQGRPDARAMSCADVQALLDRQGAAVITTGPNTFDRYVSNNGFCNHTEFAEADFIATRDAARCQVRMCRRPVRSRNF